MNTEPIPSPEEPRASLDAVNRTLARSNQAPITQDQLDATRAKQDPIAKHGPYRCQGVGPANQGNDCPECARDSIPSPTPGPSWRVVEARDSTDGTLHTSIRNAMGLTVARLIDRPDDARLIVRAVNSHEALADAARTLLAALKEEHRLPGVFWHGERELEAALALIEKEGEQK